MRAGSLSTGPDDAPWSHRQTPATPTPPARETAQKATRGPVVRVWMRAARVRRPILGLRTVATGRGLLIWSNGSNRSEPEKPNGGHETPARTASSTPADRCGLREGPGIPPEGLARGRPRKPQPGQRYDRAGVDQREVWMIERRPRGERPLIRARAHIRSGEVT